MLLTNRQYAFARRAGEDIAVTAVNNDDNAFGVDLHVPGGRYKAMLSGKEIDASNGNIHYDIPACGGEIFVKLSPDGGKLPETKPLKEIKKSEMPEKTSAEKETGSETGSAADLKTGNAGNIRLSAKDEKVDIKSSGRTANENPTEEQVDINNNTFEKTISVTVPDKPYEDMTVPELQAAILQKMAKNGLVTDDMKRSVNDNIWKDSLINWVKSFR